MGRSAPRRWLVTGAGGLLGHDLVRVLRDRADVVLTALDRATLDITDAAAVRAAIGGHDVVVNAAGWTDVDGAEAHEDAALAVNGIGAANLARACAAGRIPLLQVSTDYVFAGDATRPYREDAATAPLNAYGRTKLAGERAVLDALPGHGYVVRTAWLYGAHGRNFVTTVLRAANTRDTVDVVDDQMGQPTWSVALARQLADLGRAALHGTASAGIYHATGGGQTTWFGLARAAYTLAGLDPSRVRANTGDVYRRAARRPSYSVLAGDAFGRAGIASMPAWTDMLTDAMADPEFVATWATAGHRDPA